MPWLRGDGDGLYAPATLNRLRRTTVLSFACFLLTILMAGVLHLAEQYGNSIDQATRTARAAVRTVESFTSQTMHETFRVLEGVGDVYREQLRRDQFDEENLHLLLADKLAKMPHAAAIFVLDPNRNMLAASRGLPAQRVDGKPFNFMPGPPIQVSPDRFLGRLYESSTHSEQALEHYLPLGSRVTDANDQALGFVIAIIRPKWFQTFLESLDVGASGTIDLWNSEGFLVAATKKSDHHVGEFNSEVVKYFGSLEEEADGAGELVYAPAAGYSRSIRANGRVGAFPLAAVVKLQSEDYLSSWRQTRNRIGIAMVGILLAMIGTSLFIFAQLRRSEQNELALRQAKAAAEEANEAKSRFLAHMSHEFRTPLNAIMGFSEIIKNKVLGDGVSPVYVSYAEHIHQSGNHLLNIVNDILDMAKIESGAQPLNREPVDVSAVCASAISLIRRLAEERSMPVIVQIPFNIPSVIADERYLRQVLINLLSNAIKFSMPGMEIVVRAAAHDRGLDIAILDQGAGIDDAILRRVGEPFLQGNPSVSRIGQGTGLGLSICKQYMELLGGTLVIESTLGHGTAATVRFPSHLLVERSSPVATAAE
ncbi:MAG: ATP-binding protein [Rhodospirillaceae bacterium]|nr:ATP-binding protein [Rhodospirillaceae bacterium]